jgi:hypothetical protein
MPQALSFSLCLTTLRIGQGVSRAGAEKAAARAVSDHAAGQRLAIAGLGAFA